MTPWHTSLRVSHPLLATLKSLLQPKMFIHLWKAFVLYYKSFWVDVPRCFRQCLGIDKKNNGEHELLMCPRSKWFFLTFKNKIFRGGGTAQWLRAPIALTEEPTEFSAFRLGESQSPVTPALGDQMASSGLQQAPAPACANPHLCRNISTQLKNKEKHFFKKCFFKST